MGNGTDDRGRLRRHVRAAREWLGRAEASLERAEDVRGDLSLMLARAELARARETARPGAAVVCARRLLPLFAAALLAGGGWLAWRAALPRPAQGADAPPVRAARIAPVRETGRPAPESPPAAPETALPPARGAEEAPSPDVPARAAEEPAARGARIPSEEMQRLMSRAGQSLRAP